MGALMAPPEHEKLQLGPAIHMELLSPPNIAACMKDGTDVAIP